VAPAGHPTSTHEHEVLVSPWHAVAVVLARHGSLTAMAGIRCDVLVPGVSEDDWHESTTNSGAQSKVLCMEGLRAYD
jgi:hypothetical protein